LTFNVTLLRWNRNWQEKRRPDKKAEDTEIHDTSGNALAQLSDSTMATRALEHIRVAHVASVPGGKEEKATRYLMTIYDGIQYVEGRNKVDRPASSSRLEVH
jgi:hypothetical protein